MYKSTFDNSDAKKSGKESIRRELSKMVVLSIPTRSIQLGLRHIFLMWAAYVNFIYKLNTHSLVWRLNQDFDFSIKSRTTFFIQSVKQNYALSEIRSFCSTFITGFALLSCLK